MASILPASSSVLATSKASKGSPLKQSVASLADAGAAAAMSGKQQEKVAVAVRIRPLLEAELDAKERSVWSSAKGNTLVHNTDKGRVNEYAYSQVFGEACTTDEVYDATCRKLVASAMKGYNCTFFAYGPTGSGKTFTMRSVMREAVKDTFAHIRTTPGREFVLKASAMEIYNEVVSDLLVDKSASLRVLEDADSGPVVEGLTEQPVLSAGALEQLLDALEARRHVMDTSANQNSSRSHQIVRIHVQSRPAEAAAADPAEGGSEDAAAAAPSGAGDVSSSGDQRTRAAAAATVEQHRQQKQPDDSLPVVAATITFVDLAGSERASSSAVEGDDRKERVRQKEAGNINKSLLTLGSVIRCLAEPSSAGGGGAGAPKPSQQHVPYRDSKLTRILQPCLAGNARMTILVTISPAASQADAMRGALHFANEAKRVVMRPRVNEVQGDKDVIRALHAEIAAMRQQLEEQAAARRRDEGAAALQAALAQKEEEAKAFAEQRDKMHRKLRNLERMILRGDGSGSISRRASWSTSEPLAPGLLEEAAAGGAGAASAAGAAVSRLGADSAAAADAVSSAASGSTALKRFAAMRASWNPASSGGLGLGAAAATARKHRGGGASGAKQLHPLQQSTTASAMTTGDLGRAAGSSQQQQQQQAAVDSARLNFILPPATRRALDVLQAARPSPVDNSSSNSAGGGGGGAPCASQAASASGAAASSCSGAPASNAVESTEASSSMLSAVLPALSSVSPQTSQVTGGGAGSGRGAGGGPGAAAATPPTSAASGPPRRSSLMLMSRAALRASHAAASPLSRQETEALAALQAEVALSKHRSFTTATVPAAMATAAATTQGGAPAGGNRSAAGAVTAATGGMVDLERMEEELRRLEAGSASAAGDGDGAASAEGGGDRLSDSARQDMVAVLRSEVARIRSDQAADQRARAALASLQEKLDCALDEPASMSLAAGGGGGNAAAGVDPLLAAVVESNLRMSVVMMPDWMEPYDGDGGNSQRGEAGERGGDEEQTRQHEEEEEEEEEEQQQQDLNRGSAAFTSKQQQQHVTPRPAATETRSSVAPSAGGLEAHALGVRTTASTSSADSSGGNGSGEETPGSHKTSQNQQQCQAPSGTSGGSMTSIVVLQPPRQPGSAAAAAAAAASTPPQLPLTSTPASRWSESSAPNMASRQGSCLLSGGGDAAGGGAAAAATAGATKSVGRTDSVADSGHCQSLRQPPSPVLLQPGGPSPFSAATATASNHFRRTDPARMTAALQAQKEAVTAWYKAELARIKAAFKASAEADVAALREAVYGYKEQIERLEVQKKLLVEQVLQLEMGLEDAEERAAGLEVELARAAAERDAARVEASQAQAAAAAASARAAAAVAAQQQAAAAAAASSSPGGGAAALHMPHAHLASGLVDAGDDGGWADAPTAEALLPRITELWDALFVPLAYRSRFYLAFRGREVFYYEVEYRRLEWKRSAASRRDIERAARALDWERKSLAQQLKWDYEDAEREELFAAWGIPTSSKERKLQLVMKLWSRRLVDEQAADGMARSAELVCRLAGRDASDHFMELVFGMPDREAASAGVRPPRPLGLAMNSLVQRVSHAAARARRPSGAQHQQPTTPRGGQQGQAAAAATSGSPGSFSRGLSARAMSFLRPRRPSMTTAAGTGQQPGTPRGGGAPHGQPAQLESAAAATGAGGGSILNHVGHLPGAAGPGAGN